MGLFDKKYCDICGEKIGLLGNRKLEDGNLCKECAKKLSPWFSERRKSTVAEIKEQLEYREANREKVAQFRVTKSYGEDIKVLIDETHHWLMVTRTGNLEEMNPDVIEFSAIEDCSVDVSEHRREMTHKNNEGKQVSYNPPRYEFDYDFNILIHVNTPYFNEIKFRLNGNRNVRSISEMPTSGGLFGGSFGASIDPTYNVEYRKYAQMGDELCDIIHRIQNMASGVEEMQNNYIEKENVDDSWKCPFCDAVNKGKFCESCGAQRP